MPDRVRLQYLAIQQADVKAAVIASMSPYDWDVKANLYYLQHLEKLSNRTSRHLHHKADDGTDDPSLHGSCATKCSTQCGSR